MWFTNKSLLQLITPNIMSLSERGSILIARLPITKICSRDSSASPQKEQAGEGIQYPNFAEENIRGKTSIEKFILKFARFCIQGNTMW